MPRYNGPAVVQWTYSGETRAGGVRCIAESHAGGWEGRLVDFPPGLRDAWLSVDAMTLRLPDEEAATIQPARLSSDLITPHVLGFHGLGDPPF